MNDKRKYYYDTIYNTKRWKKLRLQHIHSDPLNAVCACCMNGHSFCCSGMTAQEAEQVEGYGKKIYVDMFIVDHIIPIDIRPDLAFDPDNLRSYCLSCHSRKTQRIDTLMKKEERINRTHDDLEDFD